MFAGSLLWLSVAGAEPMLVDVLDVGQGDAIVVRAAGKTLLIDAPTGAVTVTSDVMTKYSTGPT